MNCIVSIDSRKKNQNKSLKCPFHPSLSPLVKHHRDLLDGPEFLDKSVSDQALYEAMRAPGLSTVRRREIEKIIKDTTAFEAATEVCT